ncbi:tubulin-specific chaperone E-like [Homalodisca vitripennis]|uniref:tubulin-specific chaperone E-like n=1 Tax=Homalodisca vitripennis TaxID=197043 RepID=UPI001EE9F62D|nr:tubulin-specific chaperone E-like [Homalodisca vitripennis]
MNKKVPMKTEMVVNHDERVGRRVAVGIWHGTVRYVGSVPPAQGLWLGVEWDDPSRGKHNGSHNGVHYFHTSHPTSGSFIRIEKADFGRSCVSAIQERYGSNELTLTVEELQELQRAMNAPLVEMVGFEELFLQPGDSLPVQAPGKQCWRRTAIHVS